VGVEQVRVIVAEDDRSFGRALEAILARDGRFEVVGLARNGLDAVELAGRMAPDVLVMDIEMPVCDGVEATRLLQESVPELPVIAISGRDYDERVLEIREAGAVDFVRKARVEDDLVEALFAALPGR
jgi:chemotaxis response regulator CheB